MKVRIAIYGLLLCFCVSVWGLLDTLKTTEKLMWENKYVSVGIELKINDEVFVKTGGYGTGFIRGGGFSIGKFEEPIILESMDFKITHISF